MRQSRRTIPLFAFVALLTVGCKHKCEEDGGEIPAAIKEAGVVMEGAEACDFGGKRTDEFMRHIAYVKVYHSGYFVENALKYLGHLEGQGWERVACEGGLGTTGKTEHRMTECMKKDRKRVHYEFYNFDGTAVDIDLLELKTPEEVMAEKGGG